MDEILRNQDVLYDALLEYVNSSELSGFTIILRGELDKVFLIQLLESDSVASLILAQENQELTALYPGKVGYYESCGSLFRLPRYIGKNFLSVGGVENFGAKLNLLALSSGVRRYCSLYSHDCVEVYSFLGLTFRAVINAFLSRVKRTRVGSIFVFWDSLCAESAIKKFTFSSLSAYKPKSNSVAVVAGSLGAGGAERQIVNTLKALPERYEISFIHERPMLPPHNFFFKELDDLDFSIIYLHENGLNLPSLKDRRTRAVKYGSLLSGLGVPENLVHQYMDVFLSVKPRVVHTWLDHVNVTAGIAAVLAGVPRVVISCRSLSPDNFSFYQPYMKSAYKFLSHSERVVFLNNSKAGACSYEKWLSLPAGVLNVIHNGFDFDSFPQTEMSREDLCELYGVSQSKIVGSIMRLSEEKDPMFLLQIAIDVCERFEDVTFLIVGDGPLRRDLEDLTTEKRLTNRILFYGHDTEVYRMLSIVDVFLLTSRVEGLPNVLIEAQFYGVPVVSSDVGGVSEVVQNGGTGYLISERSSQLFSNKVIRLLEDENVHRRFKDVAPELMRERFSISSMISRTVNTYEC